MEFVNDFNLRKQANELGVKIWQTPGFLFIVMGLAAGLIMLATYFISKNYDNPQILVVSESLVAVIMIVLGTSVVRMVEQVIRLNKMKSEFVSVASHQLRTPLSAIKWETELLLTKFRKGLDEKQLKNVENISLLSHRMVRLVNDLLDVARIDQNRLILRRQRIDLKEIVQEVIKEIIPEANARHIELVFNPKKENQLSVGDREKIKLAIENLANNAVKYTTSGGKVEVKLFKKNRNLIFEIRDNGVGIPEEQQGRVFEKFFRSDNAVKYQTEGTGLGLYIAKNVVEQLGGKIWFQSIENVGSMFGFSLPSSNTKNNVKD